MKIDSKLITGLASTLILGVCAWLLSTTLQIEKDLVEVKVKIEDAVETLDKTYSENCPYCNHYSHSQITEHPLLAPTIKRAHRHINGEIVFINED